MAFSSSDDSVFPDPVYRETVLRPLFNGARTHHAEGFRAIDEAHLLMLADTGILDTDAASRIASALEAIHREVDPTTLAYTGEFEDYFFLIEAELKKRVGADLGGRLHTARSRNDIDHTLFKLSLKTHIDRLAEKLTSALGALLDKAEHERETIIVAYTHGQPAQPTTLGHYLGAVAEVLLRDIERLEAARMIVDLCPMGAAAITTSGFEIDREEVAALLGFERPLENSYGCIAAVDYVTATYAALELIFLHLGRPLQDLQFWTSFEVGQVYVPNAFVQISSIMPQKRNPVPIEHMRHLASQTFARARGMLDIMHNTPFTDMNDSEGETQQAGYAVFETGGRVVDLFAAFVTSIRIDDRHVAANIRRSCITITELADALVRREGLSFRQAHEIAAATARSVVASGGDLGSDGYAPFRTAFEASTGCEPGIDTELFEEIVSPENFVAVRARFGGPARESLDASLAGYRQTMNDLAEHARRRGERERRANEERRTRFSRLARGN
ncbi:argininosuccinate lyase [Pararhizobium mangrovi]|uniref:Argininosuccinate lyase n=1 Tax=Pararhizobium mangrovi TaxID=2590452 RepID=A0A506U5G4_9HYPH|nr:argininosuccinate lyase [Pararhizobium mangrovi]TPW27177.1 argininosuccinate lyase [Pararhizobium mangrovi]